MLEDIELVARVPLFLVKRQFDCPFSKQRKDSLFCLGCSYCKRHIRLIDGSCLPNVEMSVECTY